MVTLSLPKRGLTAIRLRSGLTQSLGDFKDLASFLASLRSVDGLRETLDGLVDHAPLYYALKARNALVRSRETASWE